MQNNLDNEDRLLDDQLATFVDRALSDRKTKEVELSNTPELEKLERIVIKLKQTVAHRSLDQAFVERLRRNLKIAWIANTGSHSLHQSRNAAHPDQARRASLRDVWSALSHQRPLAMGFGLACMLAVLFGIAILFSNTSSPDMQATAGELAGWTPMLIVAAGILIVLVILWLSKRRK